MTWKIIFILLLATQAALADFTTNVWPSWKHARQGVDLARQSWSGAVERCYAVDTNNVPVPATNDFYRYQRDNLVTIKATVKNLIPYFARTNLLDGAGTFNAYFTNNPTATTLPKWTLSNLVTVLRFPLDYFDYTPQRALNGAGPFTNDATVGHGHGWPIENMLVATNFIWLAGGEVYYDGNGFYKGNNIELATAYEIQRSDDTFPWTIRFYHELRAADLASLELSSIARTNDVWLMAPVTNDGNVAYYSTNGVVGTWDATWFVTAAGDVALDPDRFAYSGTNLPAGRTNWYTTDYGWVYMDAILAALCITEKGVVLCQTNINRGEYWADGAGWGTNQNLRLGLGVLAGNNPQFWWLKQWSTNAGWPYAVVNSSPEPPTGFYDIFFALTNALDWTEPWPTNIAEEQWTPSRTGWHYFYNTDVDGWIARDGGAFVDPEFGWGVQQSDSTAWAEDSLSSFQDSDETATINQPTFLMAVPYANDLFLYAAYATDHTPPVTVTGFLSIASMSYQFPEVSISKRAMLMQATNLYTNVVSTRDLYLKATNYAGKYWDAMSAPHDYSLHPSNTFVITDFSTTLTNWHMIRDYSESNQYQFANCTNYASTNAPFLNTYPFQGGFQVNTGLWALRWQFNWK